jgi:hypothetical protein
VFGRPADPRVALTPKGKAERFIRTRLGGWAYGAIYSDSDERTAALWSSEPRAGFRGDRICWFPLFID